MIAHRGASGLTGEDNTLRSFGRAIELGCDYVEFDVRRTRDALVCFHDARTGNTPVGELTHAELRTRAGVAVPCLQEVLEFCRGKIGLDVEIKDSGIEAEVVAAVRALQSDTPVLMKSFNEEVVARLAAMDTGCPVGLLVGRPVIALAGGAPKAAIRKCRRLGAEFLSPHHSLLVGPASALAELEAMPAYPWTVNDPADMRRLAALPIRALITDRPDLLLEVLRGRG